MYKIMIKTPVELKILIKNFQFIEHEIYDFCLYGKDDNLTVDTVCYVDHYPQEENERDYYSEFVNNNNLQLICSGENFFNVVSLCYEQKEDATVDEIVKCLNHYLEEDDFLDLN